MPSLPIRILVSFAVCLGLAACSKEAVRRGPLCPDCNVVLISMDTVRADHLGAYGYERPTSPNVDALAARSVVFEHAVSQSSWTLPAHGSMMTGLYPGRLGVTHYPARRRLPTRVPMLAEQFRKAGYATAGFTGGGFVAAHFGFARGFDIYTTDGRRFEHNMGNALRWLDRNKDRRFFLFLHGYNAHRPYYSLSVDKAAMELPDNGPVERRGFCMKGRRQRPRDLATIIKYYDAAIHHGDRQVGRFLNSLERLGLGDNTIVLITSDHGEEFFEHGNCDHVRFLYREVVNVPYILYVPGLTPEGRRVSELIPASISVPRTLLDVVGVEHGMPGPSLLATLKGKTQDFGAVYSEADSITGKLGSRGATIAMTTRRHKLIEYTEEGAEEAYDVLRDPYEKRILPATHDAYLKKKTLRAWHTAMVPLPASPSRMARARPPALATAPTGPAAAPPAAGDDAAQSESADQPEARAGVHGRQAPAGPAPEHVDEDEYEGEPLPEELAEHLRSLGYLED